MTIVIADRERNIMVADSVMSDGITLQKAVKVKKIRRGLSQEPQIVGFAGDMLDCQQWFDYLSGLRPKPKKAKNATWIVLSASMFTENTPNQIGLRVAGRFIAIGCGAHAAYGALMQGASAERAAEIACSVAVGCGGPIVVESLEEAS